MALVLCLETSSKNCSVSICKDGQVLFVKEYYDENYCHGEQLHVLIQDMLMESAIPINSFDAFALSAGPGSYTGLRIGAAAIKGFSFVLEKPIVAISTLQAMSQGLLDFQSKISKKYNFFCPTLDSRKGEVYLAMYDKDHKEHIAPFACDIESFNFKQYLDNNSVCFFGPGNLKLQSYISHKNAVFINHDYPSAKHLCQLAENKFKNKDFVDAAYFEPAYLKDFVPTKPRVTTNQ